MRDVSARLSSLDKLQASKLANNSVASVVKSPYFGKVGDIAFVYATARG